MDPDVIRNWRFPNVEQKYGYRETRCYSLSVGFGADPMDLRQLAYVHWDKPKANPSMALILATPRFWLMDPGTTVDWRRVLLGEQRLTIHESLPAEGRVCSQMRVADVIDRGREHGALVLQEREIRDADTGRLLATTNWTAVCRGDGGFTAERRSMPAPRAIPSREPDRSCTLSTLPQNALLFDLNGIINPVHSWPPAAAAAGFERPVLHGLCTMGYAHHALSRELAGYDCDRISDISARFRNVVYPGDELTTDMWVEPEDVVYRVRAARRDSVVLQGTARLRAA